MAGEGYDAGHAFLQIIPSFAGVAQAIEAEARRWGATSGRAYADSFNETVRRQTNNAPIGPSDPSTRGSGERAGGTFADGFKRRVEAALRALPKVEINADSSDADRKIAELRTSLRDLASAKIGVDLSEEDALAKLTSLREQLSVLSESSGSLLVTADTARAIAELDKLQAEIDKVRGPVIDPEIDPDTGRRSEEEGVRAGGRFASGFTTRLTAAFQALPDARIDADSSDADRRVAALRAELEALSRQRVGIDIDEATATAQIDRLKSELERLAAESPSVRVKMDTAAAAAELARLRADIDRVGESRPDVTVRADGVGGGTDVSVNVITGPALAAIGLIKTALLGLAAGAVVTPLVGGAASLLGPIGAAVGGIGSLVGSAVPGLSNVKDAFSAEGKAAKDAATSVDTSAKAQESAANQIKSAQLSLADTVRRVANDRVTSDEQVKTAEQNLAQAQQAATSAQKALTDARVAGNRSLQDMANNVKDARLAIKQDQLNVQQAQAALLATNKNAKSTDAQRRQAALDLAAAQQQLAEQQLTLQRATTDNTKAQKAGVAGTPQVIAAQKAITQAQQQQKQAQKALADTRRAQTQQQAQDASDLQRAQMALAQAQIAAASSTASGSAATRDLSAAMAELTPQERLVLDATNRFKAAFTGFGQALEPQVLPLFTNGLNILTGILPKVTPLVTATAGALTKIEDSIGRAAAGPGFTRFIATLTKFVGPALSSVATIAGNVAGAVGNLVTALAPVSDVVLKNLASLSGSLAKASTSPALNQFAKTLAQLGPIITGTIGDVGGLAGQLLKALAPLAGPTLSVVDTLARALSKLVQGLAGPLKAMFAALAPVLNQLINTLLPPLTVFFADIAGQVPGLAKAFADIVVALLPLLPVLAEMVRLAVPVLEFLAPLAPYLLAAMAAGRLLVPVLAAINFLLDANPVGLVVLGLAALVTGLLLAYNHSKTFHDFVNNNVLPVLGRLWAYLQNVVYPILKKIAQDALSGLEAAFKIVSKAVSDNKDQLTQLGHGFEHVMNFIVTKVLPILGPILKGVFVLLGAEISAVIRYIGFLVTAFDGMVTGAKATAKGVKTAFGAVKTFFKNLWGDIQSIFTDGVNFIVDHVLNPLISLLNKVLGHFGVNIPAVPRIPKPTSKTGPYNKNQGPGGRTEFASGGVLPGYTPGRDVHRFYSPTAGYLALSGGEGILRPEVVQAIGGVRAIHALNAPFNGGSAGSSGAFARGGILSRIAGTTVAGLETITDKIRAGAGSAAVAALRLAERPIEDVSKQIPVPLLRTLTGGFLTKLNTAVESFIRGTAAKQAANVGAGIAAAGGALSGPTTGNSLTYAKVIVQQAKQMGLGQKGAEIGLMTGLVESGLKNYANSKIAESLRLPHDAVGSDGYSAGIMQQQTGPFGNYWGTVAQVMNPTYAAHRFFQELLRKVPGYQSMDSGVAAQTVQVSAFPDRYDARRADADNLIKLVGYDSGGYLPPGLTTVFNGTGRPEPVLTPAQLSAVASGALSHSANPLGDLTVYAQFGEETIEARTVRVVDSSLHDVVTRAGRMT